MDNWEQASTEDLQTEILRLVGLYTEKAHQTSAFIPGQSAVPVSGRVFGAPEVRKLTEAALDFWLTTGPFNDQFEDKLKRYMRMQHLLTCNSGSSANLLAVSALTSHLLRGRQLQPGDEVITCATGFPTTVNPVLQNGLVPVFVDVDIPTYNIRADQIEAALSPKTKAIVVAHTLGNPFDLETVMDIAKRHHLYVIEDCCDALGATYGGQMVGTFGDIGSLSFYPAHHITMGEGGAVFTNNSTMKRILESFRDWGRDCYCAPGKDDTCKRRYDWQLGHLPQGYDHKYTYSHLGYNLKITDMQAAVGLAQIDRLDDFIAVRRRNFKLLHAALKPFEDHLILPEATPNSDPSWFGFPLTMRDDSMFKRDDLLRHLNRHKIGTRLLFGGNLIRQPYMIGRTFRTVGDLAVSDRVMRDTFWIGVYPGITPEMIEYMASIFRQFFV